MSSVLTSFSLARIRLVPAPCPERAALAVFPLASHLPSTDSAAARAVLFAGFASASPTRPRPPDRLDALNSNGVTTRVQVVKVVLAHKGPPLLPYQGRGAAKRIELILPWWPVRKLSLANVMKSLNVKFNLTHLHGAGRRCGPEPQRVLAR